MSFAPPSNVDKSSHSILSNIVEQRAFLNELGEKLKIASPEGWYKVRLAAFVKYGGNEILARYNDSFGKMLSTVYPEYLFVLVLLTVSTQMGFFSFLSFLLGQHAEPTS